MARGRIQKKPTIRQKKGVDNILSGKFNAIAPALREAGYAETTAVAPEANFLHADGVKVYLKTLDVKARKMWDMSLPDKIAETYLDGLSATKLYGKEALEHPDFAVRLSYADRFSKFFGWINDSESSKTKNQQFNFFSVDSKKKANFNDNFRVFLKEMNK